MTSTTELERITESASPSPRRQLAPGDRVVICGGGPAGLTAAYILAKKGYAVTVLEADDVVGGISRTARYKDYRFDIGGHRFFTKITPVEALWDEILGDEFIEVPRLSRIHYNGKFFRLSAEGRQRAHRPRALWKRRESSLSYVQARIVAASGRRELRAMGHQPVRRPALPDLLQDVHGEGLGNSLHRDPGRVGGAADSGTFAREGDSQRDLAQRAVDDDQDADQRVPVSALGPGQMWEMCARAVEEMGGEVLMGHDVTALRDARRNASWRSTSTRPTAAKSASRPTLHLDDAARASRHARLGDRSRRSVSRGGRGPALSRLHPRRADSRQATICSPTTGFTSTRPGVTVGRIQNFNNWSAAMVPEPGCHVPGHGVLLLRRRRPVGIRATRSSIELATAELEQLGLAPAREGHRWHRRADAQGVSDLRRRLSRTSRHDHARISITIPNLHTVGRNGMHKYNNQDHSMYTAMLTVENMLGAHHDVWSVNTDFEYHEEQRIDPKPAPSACEEPEMNTVDDLEKHSKT